MRYSNRPVYKRRRRVALLVLVLLVLVGLFAVGLRARGTGGEQVEQVEAPTIEQTPEVIDEQTSAEEEAVE